jgi:predicted esterase
MEEKQKILCFHGFGANSNILNYQLRQFKKEFNNIEFVTINGPISVSKNVMILTI